MHHPANTILRSEIKKDMVTRFHTAKGDLSKWNIPDEFDGRKAWGELLTPVANQGNCDSCWAFASTGTLADRIRIQSRGKMMVTLSAARLILCDINAPDLQFITQEQEPSSVVDLDAKIVTENACRGNSLYNAWIYLYAVGTTTEECVPYSVISRNLPLCSEITGPARDMCSDFYLNATTGRVRGTPARFYSAKRIYAVAGVPKDGGSELHIRYQIWRWGPVSSAMQIFPDFYTFDTNKVYHHDGKGEQITGHAVEIVGWGVENNTPFWWVKNSWGGNWGIDGYFKIARGSNHCQIEENVVACIPYLFSDPLAKDDIKDYVINTFIETPEIENIKFQAHYNPLAKEGGIDPYSGFSRRAIANNPAILNTSGLNLPDPNSFVAANVHPRKDHHPILLVTAIIAALIVGIASLVVLVKTLLPSN